MHGIYVPFCCDIGTVAPKIGHSIFLSASVLFYNLNKHGKSQGYLTVA